MKRFIIAALLVVGVAGAASAQGRQELIPGLGISPQDQFVPPDGSAGGDPAAWGPTFAQGGPDRVIPSGAGGNLPIMRAQYDPGMTGGSLGAGAAPIPAAPPGVDPAKMNALLLELARRNAAAEVLGMGNPYGSLISVLQMLRQQQQHDEMIRELKKLQRGR